MRLESGKNNSVQLRWEEGRQTYLEGSIQGHAEGMLRMDLVTGKVHRR